MNMFSIIDLIRFTDSAVWTAACRVACKRYGVFPGNWNVNGVELDLQNAFRDHFGDIGAGAARALAGAIIWAHDEQSPSFIRPRPDEDDVNSYRQNDVS